MPGNADRNYVIRRILRRGIMYGRKNLGLKTGFFEQLVAPVIESLGGVFPELKTQRVMIERAIRAEEDSFGRTLDRGLQIFNKAATAGRITGDAAFELYDTYGFPLDMTQLLATERGLSVDAAGFETEMEKQRERARAARKTEVIVGATEGETAAEATKFAGYGIDATTAVHATLIDVVKTDKDAFLVFDQTPFYAEMGGQVGDAGHALIGGHKVDLVDCVKDKSGRHLHKLAAGATLPAAGSAATLQVDYARRRAISRHHTSAHLIHWALRKMLGTHVRQFGTHKTPDRMRFDFTHFEALTPAQIKECEQLINEKVQENDAVQCVEIDYDKKPDDVLAFFGDKYGKRVRLVDIGGFSKELCGGTHVARTGEIGVIKIVAEMAIAAGTRRIEAVAGQAALDHIAAKEAALTAVSAHLSAGPTDVAKKLESLLAHQKEMEKKLKAFEAKASAGLADDLAAKAVARDGLKFVSAVVTVESPDALRSLGSQLLNKVGEGVVQLGAAFGDKASVVAFCSPAAIKAGHQAGKLVAELSARLSGKGGGKPDFAMGGGREPGKLAEALNA
jgi:alanyl-tRNA synthetase